MKEKKVRELKTFLTKMVNSGYRPPTRKEVLVSGMRRYYLKLVKQESGGPRLYRTAQQLQEGRRYIQ